MPRFGAYSLCGRFADTTIHILVLSEFSKTYAGGHIQLHEATDDTRQGVTEHSKGCGEAGAQDTATEHRNSSLAGHRQPYTPICKWIQQLQVRLGVCLLPADLCFKGYRQPHESCKLMHTICTVLCFKFQGHAALAGWWQGEDQAQ